ncbi:molecular chaperone TorD [Edwardsiella hoshinae]|uniref:Chaperone protein TorD n=1 Tax=Edwardsiella hoshinae TaxID=93378 RepID=A0A376DP25_9GAMM|nr:molecular chaperone TorD [Edwardsiella hoshinae]AOV98157.1 molecular chaperone TorD [Edwardsiella hoshinae]QPR29692.1 molecular chaperone TorD [Edwardsiella hoshinae]STC91724.1 Chaperone protein TorD [Edwardsiella hoshinae]
MNVATPLTAQHYACLYAWLAGLFAREQDETQLAHLQSSETRDWLAMLAQQPTLAPAVNALRQALNALAHRPDARLELAADFAGLFLLSQKRAALPYASCYQGERARFCQSACDEMHRLLSQAGMQLSADFPEPEDHLAIFLELLSHLHFASLTPAEASPAQGEPLRQRTLTLLLTWLPEFDELCRQHDPFGLYAALSQLLLALVRLDAAAGSASEARKDSATPAISL